MQRECIKCGAVNRNASGADDEACPRCGAIYSKARAVSPQARRHDAAAHGASTRPGAESAYEEADHVGYVLVMRAATLYPTLRAVARVGHVVAMAVAALIAIGGMVALFTGRGAAALLGGLCGAALIAVIGRVWYESTIMLADLCDATVRVAARGGR